MKRNFSRKGSGFTLIELAIVLVIGSLLLVGVVGGSSLIRSAELRAVSSEYFSYYSGVSSFFTKYDALPGDFGTSFFTGGAAGDNDGQIDYFRASSASGSESAIAWASLAREGSVTLSTNDPVIATTQPVFGSTTAATAPSSRIRGAGWVFDFRRQIEGVAAAAADQNVVVLTSTITVAPTVGAISPLGTATAVSNTVAALGGPDALSIDTKLDDGIANSGRVRGVNPAVDNDTTGTCYAYSASAASNYIITGTTITCALSFQIDPTAN